MNKIGKKVSRVWGQAVTCFRCNGNLLVTGVREKEY
jgi:hypothetical protein